MGVHRRVFREGYAQIGVHRGVCTDGCAGPAVHAQCPAAPQALPAPSVPPSQWDGAATAPNHRSLMVSMATPTPSSPSEGRGYGQQSAALVESSAGCARGGGRGAWMGCVQGVRGLCKGCVMELCVCTRHGPPPPHPHRRRPLPALSRGYFPFAFPVGARDAPGRPPRPPPSQELPGPVRAAGLPGWGGHRTTGTNRFRCARCAVSCGGRTQPDPPPGVTQRRGGVLSRSPLPKPPERCTGGGGKGVSKSPLRTDAPGRDTRRTEPPPHRRDPPQPPAVGDAVPGRGHARRTERVTSNPPPRCVTPRPNGGCYPPAARTLCTEAAPPPLPSPRSCQRPTPRAHGGGHGTRRGDAAIGHL